MIVLLVSILVLVLLVAKAKIQPFLALVLVAIATGLATGLPPVALLKSMQKGVGDMMGSIVLLLGFGVLLGNILSLSGASSVISRRLVTLFGERRATWALAVTGFLIGLAMFYNTGFLVLAPLAYSIATHSRQPMVPLAIAMAAPLSVTHCFLPPHPGATVVVNTLHADLGKTLLYGLIVAIPTIWVAAILLPRLLMSIPSQPPAQLFQGLDESVENPPSFTASCLVAVLPVLLMGGATLSHLFLTPAQGHGQWISLVGDSTISVLISVIAALVFLVAVRRRSPIALLDKAAGSLSALSSLILIIAAGGAYKQVLLDSGIGQTFANALVTLPISPLILGWLMAAVIRIATGSATVAGMTAAGVILPVLQSTGASPELMSLAIGAGSVMCSHVNDAGFWMFREWFGLSLKDTFKSWTLMETVVGILGIIITLLIQAVF